MVITKVFVIQEIDAQLWDTAGQEEFERIRVLGYENTTCFIVCFCVADFVTFDNVKRLWLPELRRHNPDAKILLVGTKSDLRKSKEWKKRASMEREKTPGERNREVNDFDLRLTLSTISTNYNLIGTTNNVFHIFIAKKKRF